MSKTKRVENTTVCCPIVYGSEATYLGKKMEGHASHRWKLYLRGPNNEEDLSCFVDRVLFTLHASFAVPIREIKRPPFEVSETGWGEFEAGLRIFFKDPTESPIDLFHNIKLYPKGGPQGVVIRKHIVDERYDEIVFTEPTRSFYKKLMKYVPSTDASTLPADVPSTATTIQLGYIPQDESCMVEEVGGATVFDDSADLEQLMGIQRLLEQHISAAKMALAQIASNLSEYPPLEGVIIDDIPSQHQQPCDPSGSSLVNDDDEWGDGGSFDFDDPTDFSIFASTGMMGSSTVPLKPFSISPLADDEDEDDDDDDDEEEDDDDDEELDYDEEDSTPRSPPTAPLAAATEKRTDMMELYEAAQLQRGYSLSLDGADSESIMDTNAGT